MAPGNGNLTAGMALLALLDRQPDSAARIRVRLDRAHPHGRWSRSTPYTLFLELAEDGKIRRIRSGEKPSDDLYETTPLGIAALEEYLRKTVAPPPLREPMQAWMQHSDEAELTEIIQVIRELEETCRVEFEEAQKNLKEERMLGNLGPADGSEWRGLMRHAVLADMVTLCGQRAVRFKKLRGRLENREMHDEGPGVGDG
jgi:DNA-binding PadR family transcriptional regulator